MSPSIEKLDAKIFPKWIQRPDQIVFLFAAPTFDLLLARDGITSCVEAFVINEPVAPVPLYEASGVCIRVEPETPLQTVRHTRIENASTAIAGPYTHRRFSL